LPCRWSSVLQVVLHALCIENSVLPLIEAEIVDVESVKVV